MAITCPKCQHENPDETLYCGKCATSLPSTNEIAVNETIEAPKEELTRGNTLANRYEIIEELGKGGMGSRTSKACQKFGCIYGAFTGGAALLAARGIKKVKDVFWLEELGMPECLWVYEVENFGPMIVTIDSHGGNLTQDVKTLMTKRMEKIIANLEG